jgi:hypothetical protein
VGQTIYETNTNRLLVWNGSAWVIPNSNTQNPTGLELITNVSFTGARPAQAAGVFSSAYANYRIVGNIYGAVGEELWMRFLSGTNTEISSGNYTRYGVSQTTSGSVTSAYVDSANRFQLSELGTSETIGNSIVMDIFRPNQATRTIVNFVTLGMNNGQHLNCTGQLSVTTQCTGFNLQGLNNNITGSVAVYGYRTS